MEETKETTDTETSTSSIPKSFGYAELSKGSVILDEVVIANQIKKGKGPDEEMEARIREIIQVTKDKNYVIHPTFREIYKQYDEENQEDKEASEETSEASEKSKEEE